MTDQQLPKTNEYHDIIVFMDYFKGVNDLLSNAKNFIEDAMDERINPLIRHVPEKNKGILQITIKYLDPERVK